MEAHPLFFRDLAYVFLAAIAGGMLAWRLRQPVILGYVLAGILLSPLTPGPSVTDPHTLELFAEIGVVLLMFSVGLEFSLKDLLRAKWVALIGGTIGILLSIGLGLTVGTWLGWSTSQGIVVGAVISVASTMVLTRLLMDRGELQTEHGLVMVAITLVEDLAVVILVVLIPSFGSLEASRLLAIAQGLGKAALLLVPAIVVAAKVVPPLLARVARTRSQELFFVVVLAICLGTAALTQAVGLSLALGAFVAGLIISGSEFAHETLAELFPLRDAFVALFFVTLGLLVNPRELFSNLGLLGTMIALIVIGKLVVWTLVVRLFRYTIWTALLVAVGLTQIGEFSFVLVKVARNSGIVGSDIYNATLAASLITILINAALVRLVPNWVGEIRHARHAFARNGLPAPEDLKDHVVLCGFGRVGSVIGTALETFGQPFLVIERDPVIVQSLLSRDVPCLFGDAAHPHLLEQARVHKASLVILAVPEADRAQRIVRAVRRMNSNVPILGRAHQAGDVVTLLQAGASEVIQPELEASTTLIRRSLHHLKLPEDRTAAYLDGFREAFMQGQPSLTSLPFPELREISLVAPTMNGKTLREAQIRERFGVTVVAVRRSSGEVLMNPPAEAILRQGDMLRVFGQPDQIKALASELDRQTS
ncbi:MAG TPA: cation:proton antiporter [Acidobacteriota bacterium]